MDEIPNKKKNRPLRFFGRLLLLLVLLVVGIVLFVRSPRGQDIIVQKAINYVSERTGTEVALERIFITFAGDIRVEGLYLEDLTGDTLLYSRSLKVDLPLWPIITGEGIGVEEVHWDGLKANILRADSLRGYNFDFLIAAFASDSIEAIDEDRTTTEPLQIMLGSLKFTDFDLKFKDDVMGIDARARLGVLSVDVETFDLANLDFGVEKARLADVDLHYIQSKPFTDEDSEGTSPLPKLHVSELILENITAHFNSQPDGLIADVYLDRFQTALPSLDLASSHFEIDGLSLSDSRIAIQSAANQIRDATAVDDFVLADSLLTFQWPEIMADVRNVNLTNNTFSFSNNGAKPSLGRFNPEAIRFSQFSMNADHISIKEGKADMALDHLSFHEASGMDLKKLGFDIELTERDIILEKLVFAASNSSLHGRLGATYPSIQELINDPYVVQFDLLIQDMVLDITDIFSFDPSLEKVEEIRVLSSDPLLGHLEVQGSLAELNLLDNRLRWGSSTEIEIEGKIQNILHAEELRYNFSKLNLKSSRGDVHAFVNEDSLGIRIPDQFSVKADAIGTMDKLNIDAAIYSSLGDILIKSNLDIKETISYTVSASTSQLQLDRLLQNEQLGPVSMTVKSNGTGSDMQDLDADLELVIQQFKFNGYDLSDLRLSGDMKDGKGNLASRYKDENLNATLDGLIRLDTISPIYSINLDVIGIDMEAMGLTRNPIRAALQLQAVFKGDLENFDLEAGIDNGSFVFGKDAYRLGRTDFDVHVSPDSTSAMIKGNLIDLELQSNTDPLTFSKSISHHLRSYFDSDSLRLGQLDKPVKVFVNGTISPAPILSEVFFSDLQELDSVQIAINFNEQKRMLYANVAAPHINYDGYLLDSLRLTLDTSDDNLNFDLGFAKIVAGPIALKRTAISGRGGDAKLLIDFDSFDEETQLIHMRSILSAKEDELRFSIEPEGLTFNKEAWSIPQDNEIGLTQNRLRLENFVLNQANQSIELTDDFPEVEEDHLALLFQNFELSDFMSYFNPDEELASGQLQGNLIVKEPFGDMGFTANLDIPRLTLLDVDMGKFNLDATSVQLDNYSLDLSLKEGHFDLDLTGELLASGNNPSLDLKLELNRLDLLVLEKFSAQEISEAKGSLSGRFTLKGEFDAPVYAGQVNLVEAGFKVRSLNSSFSLPDEHLSLDNKGLRLDDFTVLDANGNAFDLSGNILTKKLLNPQFDLSVDAQDFQILNATQEDNGLIYGLAIFDAQGTIKGDMEIPIIDLTLSVDSRTDVTYVLPSSAAEVERMDGVVIFVNREDPDAILTRTKEVTATLSGLDVKALLKIGNEARVTMILDEETGDNFQISGTGDLRFGMEPNGRMSLAGVYNVSSGSYEMNLYGLVNRKFELSPDSKVSWAGDPFDAKLDIRAIYLQEASSAPLMASVTSGLDPSAKTQYRQVLPFYVYLDVKGVLDAPEISFALDMPKDDQGALGGQVYGRLQQVNQQEEELNKQVFSLLVLNRFYPEPGSDGGSGGGAASVARKNLNDALSDQLNVFSDKLLGQTGVQLDFGLDTYTDYQGAAPTERTQLEVAAKKSLFNDKLTVSVGSEVDIEGGSNTSDGETPVIGKVSIEYVLTPDGRYRLKGFRRNEFENVIDGQTIVSGIALIFSQEFNEFNELWQAMFRKEISNEELE